MRRDELEEPGDDVRTVRLPPTAGPHYRNLALAAAALLLLLGVLIFVTPMRRGSEEPRTAPEPPARTFLDDPPVEPSEEASPAAGPWWKRFAGAPAADGVPPATEDAFRAWPEQGPPDAAASSLPPPPDPRREALTRALKSSALKRPGVTAPPPGRSAEAAGLDPMLAAAARTLPSPEDVSRLLAAAMAPAQTAHSLLSPISPSPASDESLAGLANPTLAALGAYARPAAAPGSADSPRGVSSSLAHGSSYQALRSPPVSLRTLRAGTLIPARLETAIDSDAPGPVAARVLRDVTDSATGHRVLIPAGALLLGSVGSQLPVGRNRALVAFERLLWPGVSYEIPGFEALETTGTRGLSDQVDHHTWALLGRATLLAAVGAGFEIAQPDRSDGASLAAGDVAAARMALELDRVAARILERGLDRPPTVKVRAGERFYIYLHRDLEL